MKDDGTFENQFSELILYDFVPEND